MFAAAEAPRILVPMSMDPAMFPGASAAYLTYAQQQAVNGIYASQAASTSKTTANGSSASSGVGIDYSADPSSSNSPRETSPNTNLVLTIRLLMQGKEVGSIIGKKGDQIKKIREESGAKINISDGSCPERIVTITGTLNVIGKAFNMVCNKFEEDMLLLPNSVPKPPITMRLIVPATQCGSLIGKGGSKIKDIREATGASIQVASEMLPHSTERAVTISGTADAINLCMGQVCQILLEAPPKGATISYRPKPTFNPLVIASSAASIAAQQQQAQAQQQLAAAALMGGGQVQQQLAFLQQQQQLAAVQQMLNPELARAALFNQQLAMIPTSSTHATSAGQPHPTTINPQELFLGQNGLIYTAAGAQQAALMGADGKGMDAQTAAAWQAYDVAQQQQAQQQQVAQQQQQQHLINQYALNQSMLIGAPFMKGGPPNPGQNPNSGPTSAAAAAAAAAAAHAHHQHHAQHSKSGSSAAGNSSRFQPY